MQRENFYSQNKNIKKPLPVIQDIVNQLKLTDPQAEKFKIVAEQFMFGKITREDVILKSCIRDGMVDLALITGFILLVNWLNQSDGFKGVFLPHINPFKWSSGKYDNKGYPNYKSMANPLSRFERDTLHTMKQMCAASADENEFVMSYEEAHNLVGETYPGYMQVDANCKITDWQAAKHIYHANGMGVDLSKYGFTQQELEKIRGESQYKGGGLIAYARKGYRLPPIEMVQDYQLRLKISCEKAPIKRTNVPYYDVNGAWQSTVFATPKTEDSSPIIIAFNESTGDLITGDKQNPTVFKRFRSENYLGGKAWMLKWSGK